MPRIRIPRIPPVRPRIAARLLCGGGLALALAAGAPARAQEPADWMAMDEVFLVLADAGYAQVREVEAERDHWRGKAVRAGRALVFEAEPHTGAVLRTHDLR